MHQTSRSHIHLVTWVGLTASLLGLAGCPLAGLSGFTSPAVVDSLSELASPSDSEDTDSGPEAVEVRIIVNPSSTGGEYSDPEESKGILEGKVAILKAQATTSSSGGIFGSSYDTTACSWQWTKLDGPEDIELRGASTESISFVAPEVEEDTEVSFQVVATAQNGGSGTAQAKLTVYETSTKIPESEASATWSVAGSDDTVDAGELVTLSGSAAPKSSSEEPYEYGYYYDDGRVEQLRNDYAFEWRQTGPTDEDGKLEPAVKLSGADTATASFEAPAVVEIATLAFELTATDALGRTSTAKVTMALAALPLPEPKITSEEWGWDNKARSGETVKLIGEGGEGGVEFEWSQDPNTEPPVDLQFNGPREASFTVPCMTSTKIIRIVLKVTDVLGRTQTAILDITLEAHPVPEVSTGYSGERKVGQPIALTCTVRSNDPGPYTYAWTKVAGGDGIFNGLTNQAQTVFTPTASGTYIFQVAVTDSCGLRGIGTVTIKEIK